MPPALRRPLGASATIGPSRGSSSRSDRVAGRSCRSPRDEHRSRRVGRHERRAGRFGRHRSGERRSPRSRRRPAPASGPAARIPSSEASTVAVDAELWPRLSRTRALVQPPAVRGGYSSSRRMPRPRQLGHDVVQHRRPIPRRRCGSATIMLPTKPSSPYPTPLPTATRLPLLSLDDDAVLREAADDVAQRPLVRGPAGRLAPGRRWRAGRRASRRACGDPSGRAMSAAESIGGAKRSIGRTPFSGPLSARCAGPLGAGFGSRLLFYCLLSRGSHPSSSRVTGTWLPSPQVAAAAPPAGPLARDGEFLPRRCEPLARRGASIGEPGPGEASVNYGTAPRRADPALTDPPYRDGERVNLGVAVRKPDGSPRCPGRPRARGR